MFCLVKKQEDRPTAQQLLQVPLCPPRPPLYPNCTHLNPVSLQHPFLASASHSVAARLAQRAAASAEGRRESVAGDDGGEDGTGSVVHRKPAAVRAADAHASDAEAAADGGSEGYSTVIFRNPPTNFSSSAQDPADSLDGDAGFGTVIVRRPAAAVSGIRDPIRLAALEIPVSPNSVPSSPSPTSTISPSSPGSVLVSFAPESTGPLSSPLFSRSPPVTDGTRAAPPSSSSPFASLSSFPPSQASPEQLDAVSHAVAFAHNRRNKPGRGRIASESGGGVSLEQFNTVNRNRSKSGSSVPHGVLLGR